MSEITHKFTALSTNIIIKVNKPENISTFSCNEAIQSAVDAIKLVGKRFTRFEDNSELGKINFNSHKKRSPIISLELAELISFSLDLAKLSNGKFDPTIIDLLENHGYSSSFNKSETQKKIKNSQTTNINSNKNRPSWKDIILTPGLRPRINLNKNQRLDLGGVGKGYGIRKASEQLLHNGFKEFSINAGGDIYVNGRSQKVKLGVNLIKPEASRLDIQLLGEIEIKNECLASSGSWVRTIGKFHHLINPESGDPDNRNLQSFVIANDPMVADGLATVAFFVTEAEFEEFSQLISNRYGAKVAIITSAKELLLSDNFPELNQDIV